jgi:hypothetical protein
MLFYIVKNVAVTDTHIFEGLLPYIFGFEQ